MSRHSRASRATRRVVLQATDLQQAKQEYATWLASQVEPGAGDPQPGSEPRGGSNRRSMTDEPPEAGKALRSRPRAKAPHV